MTVLHARLFAFNMFFHYIDYRTEFNGVFHHNIPGDKKDERKKGPPHRPKARKNDLKSTYQTIE